MRRQLAAMRAGCGRNPRDLRAASLARFQDGIGQGAG